MSTEPSHAPSSPALVVARTLLFGFLIVFLAIVSQHFGLWRRDSFIQETLTVLIAVLAVVGATHVGRGPHRSRLVVLLLVVATVFAFQVQAGKRMSQMGRPAQLGNWGIYHYYLGSKYFEELQYTELYRETLKADAQGPNKFKDIPKIRNLDDYKREKSAEFRDQPRHERWTDARWEEFRQDVWYIGGLRIAKDWNKILNDRGYNPPPSYTLIAGRLNNLFSVRSAVGQTILALLDVLVIFAAFLVSIRAYGLKRSLLVLLGYTLWYGNWGRIYGQFWINDWFAACWAAVSMWRMEKFRWAGGLVAYATLVRVFPGVLALGPLVAALPGIVKTRTVPRSLVKFVSTGLLVTVLMVGLSAVKYGPGAWVDFVGNITTHSAHHETGLRRVGLKHLAALDWQNGLKKSAREVPVRDNMDANANLHRGVALVCVVLVLIAMLRSDPHDAMLIGLGIVFVGTVASRYYGAVFCLWLLLRAQRARAPDREGALLGDFPKLRAPAWIAMDAAFFLMLHSYYAAPVGGKYPRVGYFWGNAGTFAFLLALLALTALADRRPEAPTSGQPPPEPSPA